MLENCVIKASKLVTHNVILPGVASSPSQNDNHDNITISALGVNTCIKWWAKSRSKVKFTYSIEYDTTKRKKNILRKAFNLLHIYNTYCYFLN